MLFILKELDLAQDRSSCFSPSMVSPLVFSRGSVNKLQARLVVFRPGPEFLERLAESLWEQHGTTKQGPFLSPGWSSVCAVWCDVPFPLGIPQVGDL